MECLSAGGPGNGFALNQHWEAGKETYARKHPPNLMKIAWHCIITYSVFSWNAGFYDRSR